MSRLILRMRVRHPLVFVTVAMLLWQSGCSGGKQSERSRKTTQESLPAVDIDTAISVDEDRIVIASPAGWTRSPRSSNYLMRFQPGPKKSYPSIVVTGAEAPADLREISSENHKDFVAAIEEELKQGFTDKGSKITKKPVAVTLGDHFGVYYAVPGTAKVEGLSEPIERQCYRLIFSGRMYTVEARAPKGSSIPRLVQLRKLWQRQWQSRLLNNLKSRLNRRHQPTLLQSRKNLLKHRRLL